MPIDADVCLNWAEEILAKGHCSLDDIDRLVADCEGNGDLDELRINLQRNLEAAGFNLDQAMGPDADLWDVVSDISSDDLAEAIEAALTRRTRLPGTQRFVMEKSDELQLLEPMMRAKQQLQLGILASKTAVETILAVMDSVRDGSRDPGSVSLRTIIPSRPGHAETSEVMAAADALRSWHTTGRVMDGKTTKRGTRCAGGIGSLAGIPQGASPQTGTIPKVPSWRPVSWMPKYWLELGMGRACAPNPGTPDVEEGEDPEDVFQVAFMGLQLSTRRFDPERGGRFLPSATFRSGAAGRGACDARAAEDTEAREAGAAASPPGTEEGGKGGERGGREADVNPGPAQCGPRTGG